MKLHRKLTSAILGVALCCTAVSSSALTLGRARGAVLLGQALKLTVPIRLESGEGSSAWCFDADVFYGDSRQDASRVTVTHDISPQSETANLFISSFAGVDEPVVTVYVRAGCDSKSTRRYVLLAEPPTDVVATPKAAAQPVLSAQRARENLPQVAGPGPAAAGTDRGPEKPGRRPAAPKQQPEAAIAQTVQPTSQTPPDRVAKSVRPARAHLKLEPLDVGEIRDPNLKLSNELSMLAPEDLGKRELAAALWRSLNATPEDLLGAQKRRAALEADLKGLHDITSKNQLLLQELKGRLEQAESQRYANPLVYGLLLVLLLCVVGLVYGWRHLQRAAQVRAHWWRDDAPHERTRAMDGVDKDMAPAPAQPATDRDGGRAKPRAAPPDATTVERPRRPLAEVDIDLHLDEPVQGRTLGSAPSAQALDMEHSAPGPISRASGHQDFVNSVTASFRAVNTQEMLDVRQQAEFFMTLGQHEEAIGLLKESILSSPDSNPLVYLDLLKVLHTLGRKPEYDDYRNGFNAIFSGHVPPYAEFNRGGSGLEAYPDVCQRIIALWPSEEAVSFIESCLVRDDSENGVQGFDLEAFRDLLLLHGVARRIAASFDSGFLPFSAAKTGTSEMGASFMPSDEAGAIAAQRTQPVLEPAILAPITSVDVDLSEPPGNLIDFDTADLLPTAKRPQ